MVTTSAAPALSAPGLLVEQRMTEAREEHGAAVACSILTPSGALLARAMARPRPAALPAETWAVEVSEVRPLGALEPLLRGNPQVVLRTPHDAQLALRIDHIIGPRQRRTYYMQTLEAAGD